VNDSEVFEAFETSVVFIGRCEHAVWDDAACVRHDASVGGFVESVGAVLAAVLYGFCFSAVFFEFWGSWCAVCVVHVEVIETFNADVFVSFKFRAIFDFLRHTLFLTVQIKGLLTQVAFVTIQKMQFAIIRMLHQTRLPFHLLKNHNLTII
jgi:thiol-disulfide isomerase/thioredoxin